MHKKLTAYLAGPMEFAAKYGSSWRNKIKQEFEIASLNIDILNPCKIEVQETGKSLAKNMTDIKKLKQEHRWEELLQIMTPIQHRDYTCIDASNFIVAFLDHKSGPGGTYAEIEYAKNKNIPIFGLCLGDIVDENSWILTSILLSGGKICISYKELICAISDWI